MRFAAIVASGECRTAPVKVMVGIPEVGSTVYLRFVVDLFFPFAFSFDDVTMLEDATKYLVPLFMECAFPRKVTGLAVGLDLGVLVYHCHVPMGVLGVSSPSHAQHCSRRFSIPLITVFSVAYF